MKIRKKQVNSLLLKQRRCASYLRLNLIIFLKQMRVVNRKEVRREMNIYEATKKALQKGKCIKLKNCNVKIKLEYGDVGTIMQLDGSHPVKGWQPTTTDLTSNSWILTE